MEMRLRSAEERDYPGVNGIAAEYQKEHAAELPGIFAETRNVLGLPWFRSFLGVEGRTIVIAECEGAVAAFAMMEMKESMRYAAFVPRKYAVIYEFGVGARFHRQGIGSRLFAACREWASARGAGSLELTMFEFNRRALAFYESVGMETLSRTLSVGLGDTDGSQGAHSVEGSEGMEGSEGSKDVEGSERS